MEKVLQELFWAYFLSAHTIQTVPKYIWMQHCVSKILLGSIFTVMAFDGSRLGSPTRGIVFSFLFEQPDFSCHSFNRIIKLFCKA